MLLGEHVCPAFVLPFASSHLFEPAHCPMDLVQSPGPYALEHLRLWHRCCQQCPRWRAALPPFLACLWVLQLSTEQVTPLQDYIF